MKKHIKMFEEFSSSHNFQMHESMDSIMKEIDLAINENDVIVENFYSLAESSNELYEGAKVKWKDDNDKNKMTEKIQKIKNKADKEIDSSEAFMNKLEKQENEYKEKANKTDSKTLKGVYIALAKYLKLKATYGVLATLYVAEEKANYIKALNDLVDAIDSNTKN